MSRSKRSSPKRPVSSDRVSRRSLPGVGDQPPAQFRIGEEIIMISTGSKRSLRLVLAAAFACSAVFAAGCNDEAEETTPASNGTVSQNGGSTETPDPDPAPETDSEAHRTVLAFQQAVLDLELEAAQAMVEETSRAYQSVTVGLDLIETLKNPQLPDSAKQMSLDKLTESWRGASTELVLEEGNSAIIAVTKSNGESVDVNLNFFDGEWLINSPDNILELR